MSRYGGTNQLLSIVFENESKQYNFAIQDTGLFLFNNTDGVTVWQTSFV